MEILLRCFGFTAHIQVGREEEDPGVLVETQSETEIAEPSTEVAGFARH